MIFPLRIYRIYDIPLRIHPIYDIICIYNDRKDHKFCKIFRHKNLLPLVLVITATVTKRKTSVDWYY